jgi:hypothetical protein
MLPVGDRADRLELRHGFAGCRDPHLANHIFTVNSPGVVGVGVSARTIRAADKKYLGRLMGVEPSRRP